MFSIIMASYNYENYIGEAIESVLAQQFADWELIIVDDGSTDRSMEVIERYIQQDTRIRLFCHEAHRNLGLAASVQYGLSFCTGEYVTFLESDDIWAPNRLQRMQKELSAHPEVDIADNDIVLFGDLSGMQRYNAFFQLRERFYRNRTFPCNIFRLLLLENFIPTFSCVTVRRQALLTCCFDYTYRPWLDRSLWLQICFRGTFLHIPEPLTRWRIHQKSYISREREAYRKQKFKRTYELLKIVFPNARIKRLWFWSEMLLFQLWRTLTRRLA